MTCAGRHGILSVMDERARSLAAQRLRMAFDLFEAGCEMRLAQLKREFPDAGDDELRVRLDEWLRERPGAEFGDAVGRPRSWPLQRGS